MFISFLIHVKPLSWELVPICPPGPCVINFLKLFKLEDNYSIMVFVIHQHESATDIYISPILNPSPTSLVLISILPYILPQRHYFINKGLSSQGYDFSSGHLCMWEFDYKESWVLKNWCFWTVVLEKTLESPLDCKEIQPVHPKGDQSWILIGRTDVEAETPILWPPDANSWLIWKHPDAGKDRG